MIRVGYFEENNHGYFRIYAPFAKELAIEIADFSKKRIPMQNDSIGWFTCQTSCLPNGTKYWIIKDGFQRLPDPASKSQPDGVHQASEIIHPEKINNPKWHGILTEDAIIYELHIGTFSKEGTINAARKKLSYLKELGINTIELMPIAAFPGTRNWGYDGTYLFAVSSNYGTYQDLQNFIKEAHENCIAVILDVVYNHFGPEGNYSGILAPYTKCADTPWGAAINFDSIGSSGIREFYLANTEYWIKDIGFDGLRMDAVSLIIDNNSINILKQINILAQNIGMAEGRHIIMIAEHLRNEASVTRASELGYKAQWCDDLNYSIYAYFSHEKFGHYQDFGSFNDIEKALTKGFVYDGKRLNSVTGWYMGEDGSEVPPEEIVMHMQNHDQIGNRPDGNRIRTVLGTDKNLLAATILFSAPYIPMIFMGEEYGETNPFLFFEDFSDLNLINAVKDGRAKEFSFVKGHTPEFPHSLKTFQMSKLSWIKDSTNSAIFNFYKKLIDLRTNNIIGRRLRAENKIEKIIGKDIIIFNAPHSITVANCSNYECSKHDAKISDDAKYLLSSNLKQQEDIPSIQPYTAVIYKI